MSNPDFLTKAEEYLGNPSFYDDNNGVATAAANAILTIQFGPNQTGISHKEWQEVRDSEQECLEAAQNPGNTLGQDLAFVGLARHLLDNVAGKHGLKVTIQFQLPQGEQ